MHCLGVRGVVNDRLDRSPPLEGQFFSVFALGDQMNPQLGVRFAALLPHPVVDRRGHALRVVVGQDLQVPQPGHVADALHEVVAEVVRGNDQTAQVDETGHGQQGKRPPRRVHHDQLAQSFAANLAHFVQHVARVHAVQLQVFQFQPPAFNKRRNFSETCCSLSGIPG